MFKIFIPTSQHEEIDSFMVFLYLEVINVFAPLCFLKQFTPAALKKYSRSQLNTNFPEPDSRKMGAHY
jgi:hypothetical protein